MRVLVTVVFAIESALRVRKSLSHLFIGVVIVVFEYQKGQNDSERVRSKLANWAFAIGKRYVIDRIAQ